MSNFSMKDSKISLEKSLNAKIGNFNEKSEADNGKEPSLIDRIIKALGKQPKLIRYIGILCLFLILILLVLKEIT